MLNCITVCCLNEIYHESIKILDDWESCKLCYLDLRIATLFTNSVYYFVFGIATPNKIFMRAPHSEYTLMANRTNSERKPKVELNQSKEIGQNYRYAAVHVCKLKFCVT